MRCWIVMKPLKEQIEKYRDVLLYLVFGALTTIVNFAVYFPLYNFTILPIVISNALAWIAAALFAFITNKRFVFNSKSFSVEVILPEFLKFIGCRVVSFVLETVCLYITVEIFLWNGNIWKLLISVLVIILNYIGSKLFVFRKSP